MRREDWPHRLQDAIEAAAERPFSWETHNCCSWVGDAVEATTGINPVAEWRGRATSETAAMRILNRHFGGSLVRGWTQILGPPIPPALAGRGDVVVVEVGDVTACGVVDLTGERVACLKPDGLEFVPVTAAVAAWRV